MADTSSTQSNKENPKALEKDFADTPWLDPKAKPYIQIKGLSKQFDTFNAVDAVNLDIYQGELFTILGSSGCGKSTLLRMLAGLETPSSGQIIIDGVDMTHIPPYERPVNMMFQSYAVFPHMTVEQNVGYGLTKEKVAKDEIKQRVQEMLELVQLSELSKRKPNQLSGGQRQRVALARALIKRPKVLLLDEPLAALDKKLREQTQFELINIQYKLGTTFVVVTHDQEEAMTLSSRLAVMKDGQFIQLGTPTQVYESPCNRYIAEFFGTVNLFEAEVSSVQTTTADGDTLITAQISKTGDKLSLISNSKHKSGDKITVGVRPEKISISQHCPQGDNQVVIKGVVEDLAYYGNRSIYRVRTHYGQVIQVGAQNYQRSEQLAIEWDDEVFLSWQSNCSLVLTQ